MGAFVYAGIQLTETNHWVFDDKEIEEDELYRLAIPDMYTFGHLFPEIRDIENKTYLMPGLLRDILAWKLAANAS